MEYQFSKIVDPSSFDSKGLISDIPVRKNLFSEAEYVGTFRAQEDWNAFVAPLGEFKGGLDPTYPLMSVDVPECRPERLEMVAYGNEFAFLYDDAIESMAHDQAQMFREMAAIDRPRAMVTMKAWAEFLRLTSSRDRQKQFESLEEYIPFRVWDVGQMHMFGLITFGMGLTIPESDMDKCNKDTAPACAAIALANDLFSWDKERDLAKRDNLPHIVNAVWVIMGQYSVSEEEARKICHSKVVELVEEYKETVERYKNDQSICLDLKKYAEALLYNISGNLIWSLTCPRYNPGTELNSCQRWMQKRLTQP
ncbi:uncharacterized protein N0V89_001580 [Didymosphaeria variabile]|uniref:Terpenoid synthase n=1 Tax=Didymosphaeria variabile TaxID=1932322 RepID=A0A9W9CGZ0_9PLEO|nr:uncharacterized protein N0V89_001580 [Didymosphaeria variabile]KAJ4361011.1 hypothetical protein N0V89_001580 [Didymosphaeria variabile]